MLVAVSKRTADEGALRLTAQLMDVAPCPRCDFRKEFCRCEANSLLRLYLYCLLGAWTMFMTLHLHQNGSMFMPIFAGAFVFALMGFCVAGIDYVNYLIRGQK